MNWKLKYIEFLGGDELVYKNIFNSTDITDAGLELEIFFENEETSDFQTYLIKIQNISPATSSEFGVLAHSNTMDYEQTMTWNSEKLECSLDMSVGFQNAKTALIYNGMWAVIIILPYVVVLFIGNDLKKNFLAIAISCGLTYMFFSAFPHTVDESTHFFRSFAIAEGAWHDDINENGDYGAELPSNYAAVLSKVESMTLLSLYANRELYFQPFSSDTEFYVNNYMTSVIPFDHTVSSVGIWIGQLLNLSVVAVIYLSRFADLLFYIVVCYFAIKKTPFFKTIFFGISLLPMALFLAGSCSQDPVLVSSSLLFIAICLKYIFDKENNVITWQEILSLFISVVCVASIKYVIYAPIFLILFFIPRQKFRKHHKPIIICGVFIVTVAIFFYQLYLLKSYPFIEDRSPNVSVGEQVSFMLNNIYYTYRNFGSFSLTYLFSKIINEFTIIMTVPSFQIIGQWVVLGSIFIKDKYEWSDKKKKNIFIISILVISFVIYALIMAALYVGFTAVGAWGILGIQGRYILPVLPLICIALSNIPIKNNIKNYEVIFSFFLLMANVLSIGYSLYSTSSIVYIV